MTKQAAKKAYDNELAKFTALNNREAECKTVAEYETLKASQRAERDAIHVRLERLRKWL